MSSTQTLKSFDSSLNKEESQEVKLKEVVKEKNNLQHEEELEVESSLMCFFKQLLFWSIHAGCFLAFYTGVSWTAVGVCFFFYFIRMFGITGAYHRYFSHRSYKTSRVFQFCLAFLGASAAQKGPIWWASHHRHHHKHSDTEEDVHTPVLHGVWWSHVGWVMSSEFTTTNLALVKDLLKFPELKWIDRNHFIPPLTLLSISLALGYALQILAPSLGTNAFQMFIWGFCISTTLLYHGTFLINSATHLIGSRRFNTTDESRNNFFTAIITLGEGWHNNHHRYPSSERQGFYWWEVDISHYILRFLEAFGLVWDLRVPPKRIYEEAKKNKAEKLQARK